MQIGGYELLGEIARGGMGVVYRARDPRANRLVAIKVLQAETDLEDHQIKRLQVECESLTKLKHGGVVTIHDAGVHNGHPYLVQEFLSGASLEQRLARTGALAPEEAMELVAQVAEAVQHVHELGLLHRDIKPANIIESDRGPVLVDFGLAKDVSRLLSGPSLTKTGLGFGTPGYWSPEQALGEKQDDAGRPVGPATDVYSLGATLYALLTGRPPIEGRTTIECVIRTASKVPPEPSRSRPEVSPALDAICMQCLEKDAGDRYPSAKELTEDLRRCLAGQPVSALRRAHARRLAKALSIAALLVASVPAAWAEA